jgi:hypothetical protein
LLLFLQKSLNKVMEITLNANQNGGKSGRACKKQQVKKAE